MSPRLAPRPIAAGLVLCLSLWATAAIAKVHPHFQAEIDKVCAKVGRANTAAEVRAIDQTDGTRFAQLAENARRNATLFNLHISTKLEFEQADKKRHDLDVALSDELTAGREANLRKKIDDTKRDFEPIQAKINQRDALAENMRRTRISRPQADLSADQARHDQLDAEIRRDGPELQRARDAAQKAYDDRIQKIAQLHRDKPAVHKAAAEARTRWDDMEKAYQSAQTLADQLEETHGAIVECIDKRLVTVDPNSDAALMQRYLDTIERIIASAERKLKATEALCAQMPEAIRRLKGWAAAIHKQASDAAALTPVDPALVQQHDQTILNAIAGANNAAAEVAQTRARATKAAADACAAAQVVERDPRGADAPGRLVEAQRLRAVAENEVVRATIELQRIRAAYAAAMLMSAQLDGGANQPADVVTAIGANLKNLKLWQANIEGKLTSPTPWKADTERAGQALDAIRHQPKLREFALRHRERVEKLRERHQALVEAPDCLTRFTTDIVGAAADIGAAEAQYNAIPTALKAAPMKPAQSPSSIEAIYNAARGVADGTASEATNAVRCVAAATNAFTNPPAVKPPPPVAAGIKCRYKRPDGSTIEVTLFDTKTCPTEIPGHLVDWKPEGKPDMTQPFDGKWFGRERQFEYITISGGVNSFSLVGHWQSDARPGAKHDYTGQCTRTGTRTAECKGQGTYWDAYKTATYTYTMKLSLGSDAKVLHYVWTYGKVTTRNNDGTPRRNNDSVTDDKVVPGTMSR